MYVSSSLTEGSSKEAPLSRGAGTRGKDHPTHAGRETAARGGGRAPRRARPELTDNATTPRTGLTSAAEYSLPARRPGTNAASPVASADYAKDSVDQQERDRMA